MRDPNLSQSLMNLSLNNGSVKDTRNYQVKKILNPQKSGSPSSQTQTPSSHLLLFRSNLTPFDCHFLKMEKKLKVQLFRSLNLAYSLSSSHMPFVDLIFHLFLTPRSILSCHNSRTSFRPLSFFVSITSSVLSRRKSRTHPNRISRS